MADCECSDETLCSLISDSFDGCEVGLIDGPLDWGSSEVLIDSICQLRTDAGK